MIPLRLRAATSTASLAFVLALAACGPPEGAPAPPPAEALQSFETPAQEASVFPAPSPSIARAVGRSALKVEEGRATYYADTFDGRRTASGRVFRQSEMVAAHRAFPFGTRLRVTNLRNQRQVEVTVVDRGPYGQHGELGPIIDLSSAAADALRFRRAGSTRVRIEVLKWGP